MVELSQFIIVAGFGAICFGCGYLIALILVRNQWREEVIKRDVARYNWRTGRWEWASRQKTNTKMNEARGLPQTRGARLRRQR